MRATESLGYCQPRTSSADSGTRMCPVPTVGTGQQDHEATTVGRPPGKAVALSAQLPGALCTLTLESVSSTSGLLPSALPSGLAREHLRALALPRSCRQHHSLFSTIPVGGTQSSRDDPGNRGPRAARDQPGVRGARGHLPRVGGGQVPKASGLHTLYFHSWNCSGGPETSQVPSRPSYIQCQRVTRQKT